MSETSFYNEKELLAVGFASFGRGVKVSRFARFYSPEKIRLGDNVRIDDFCVISGKVTIGSYVHISVGVYMFASESSITIADFCSISSRVAIYAQSDDFSGRCMANPMVPAYCRHVITGGVVINRHVIVGCGCVIMPGTILMEGCALGAMSFVGNYTILNNWTLYAGIPCREIGMRSNSLMKLVNV